MPESYSSTSSSSGGGYYGSGGYGGSYYGSPGPGGYLNATYDLTGPGSTAYVHEGNYSSYAYEGYNGSTFERNITEFSGGYAEATKYYVSDGSYSVSQNASFTYHNPAIYYSDYGYGSSGGGAYAGNYGSGVTGVYTSTSFETSYSGDYKSISSQSFGETTYADGAYHDTYSTTFGEYEGGMKVPGTATAYSTSSYGYVSNDAS